MPRNKTAKLSRKNTKAHQMENEIYATPAKLAALLDKEISALKQKESKFMKTSNKINAQIKKSAARMIKADKMKHTSAGKKKLKKAKKSHSEMVKSQVMHNKQLQEIIHSLQKTQNNHAKLIALGKYLNQFEKEWAKNSKQNKASAVISKSKKVNTKRKKKTSTMEDQPSPMESFETTGDQHIAHEEAEVVS